MTKVKTRTSPACDPNDGGDSTLGEVLNRDNDGAGLQIKNIGDPTEDQDAATKKYVDDEVAADQHYRGLYASLVALQTAIPTGNPGDYADVDAGVGTEIERYIWDDDDEEWIAGGGAGSFSALTGSPSDNAALAAALALKLDSTITYKTEADDHTLDADDLTDINAGKDVVFLMTKASASTLTLPQDSALAIGVGKKFKVRRTHASGAVTIAAGSGASASGTYGDLLDPGQNVDFEIQKISANTFLVQNGATGAWVTHVPSFTGFSVQPSAVDCTYLMLGRKAFILRVDMSSSGGTSNSTGFTMTSPFLSRSQTRIQIFALNASVFISTAQAYTATNSNVISFFIGAGLFSSSGTKGAFFEIIIEMP